MITALSAGKEFLGSISTAMRAYGLMCEDDEIELRNRQERINKHYGVNDISNIKYISRIGSDNLLMDFNKDGSGKLSKFFFKLLKDIKEFNPDIVLLDTAADLIIGRWRELWMCLLILILLVLVDL